MTCKSGCCSHSVLETVPEQIFQPQSLDRGDLDKDLDEVSLATEQACDDVYCSNKELLHGVADKPAECQHACCIALSEGAEKHRYRETDIGIVDDESSASDDDSADCQDTCCGGLEHDSQPGTGCQAETIGGIVDNCASESIGRDCFESEQPQHEDPNSLSCCKGKTLPCCDVSCLERIALRACEHEKTTTTIDAVSQSRCSEIHRSLPAFD